MPLISVIVPVYRVEPYLRRCVDSILNQTLKDFELILVDDGSPDNCPVICDEYANQDKRVVVIHKPNGGLSSARNAGLNIAQGEYISFVDSDDYIDRRFLELLINNIGDNDIAVCNFYELSSNGTITKTDFHASKYSIESFSTFVLVNNIYMVVVWNKLYSKRIFYSNKFKENTILEDEYFFNNLIDKRINIISISEPLYYYVRNKSSIINSNSVRDKNILRFDVYMSRALSIDNNENLFSTYYKLAKDITISFCINEKRPYCVLKKMKAIFFFKKTYKFMSKNKYKKTTIDFFFSHFFFLTVFLIKFILRNKSE